MRMLLRVFAREMSGIPRPPESWFFVAEGADGSVTVVNGNASDVTALAQERDVSGQAKDLIDQMPPPGAGEAVVVVALHGAGIFFTRALTSDRPVSRGGDA